jgi:hypothetical protein
MPYSQGDLITAAQFNELVDQYERYWGDIYSSSSFSDADNSNHRYGWGQVESPPYLNTKPTVSQNSTIEYLAANRLATRLNAGLYHLDETYTLLPKYAQGSKILASEYQTVENKIALIDDNKFGLNSFADLAPGEAITDNGGALWATTINAIIKFSFTDYTQARYFFNSGGKLTFNLSATSSVTPDEAWQLIFDQWGEMRLSADSVTNTGGVNNLNGFSVGGFYDIPNTGDEVELFYAKARSLGMGYVYGGYCYYGVHSAYSCRRVTLTARAEETTTFDIYIRVTLYEDVEEDTYVNTEIITLEAGFITPSTTPTDDYINNTSGGDNFKAENYIHQFIEREEPTVYVYVDWTSPSEYFPPGYIEPGYVTVE